MKKPDGGQLAQASRRGKPARRSCERRRADHLDAAAARTLAHRRERNVPLSSCPVLGLPMRATAAQSGTGYHGHPPRDGADSRRRNARGRRQGAAGAKPPVAALTAQGAARIHGLMPPLSDVRWRDPVANGTSASVVERLVPGHGTIDARAQLWCQNNGRGAAPGRRSPRAALASARDRADPGRRNAQCQGKRVALTGRCRLS